jgi:hypothetical protein
MFFQTMGNSGSSEISKDKKHKHHYANQQPPRPQQQQQPRAPVQETKPKEEPTKDVMISYSRTNTDVMKKLKGILLLFQL